MRWQRTEELSLLPQSVAASLPPGSVLFCPPTEQGAAASRLLLGAEGVERGAIRSPCEPAELLTALTRQMAGLSHDIGGGLTSVLAALEALEDLEDPGEQADMKDAMSRQLAAVSSTLRELRMLAFPLQLEVDMIDVRKALEEVAATMKEPFHQRRVYLHWSCDEGELRLPGDPGLLQGMVGQLAVNSREASAKGSAVRLEAREIREGQARWLALDVLDAGAGIPRERLPRLGEVGAFEGHNRVGVGLFSAVHAAIKLGGLLLLCPRQPRGTSARFIARLAR